jgi:hypothetical protein
MLAAFWLAGRVRTWLRRVLEPLRAIPATVSPKSMKEQWLLPFQNLHEEQRVSRPPPPTHIFSPAPPFDTGFDTASRFSVLNGVTRQHGARTGQRRLCGGITRNHERANHDKTIENIEQN